MTSKAPVVVNLLRTPQSSGRDPVIPNSHGQNVVEGCTTVTTSNMCQINADLVDWETAMETLITDFGPTGAVEDFGGKTTRCGDDPSSNECQNWDKINRQILPQYCKRIGYFANINNDGDCPLYNVNPFNPVYPQSKGCSKMTSPNSLCSQWVLASQGNQGGFLLGIVDNNIEKYCDGQLTPDCACQRANESVVFNEVSVRGVGTTTCWWLPCQAASQGSYLIRKSAIGGKCPNNICVNVSNVFLDNSEIRKDLIVQQVNACGNPTPPKSPWYEQWWFWIIIFGLVIILLAIIIYYSSIS